MHDGHRKRLLERLRGGGALSDVELLEALLFNAYPRVNTNPIAHRLLTSFRTLRGVFDAPFGDLAAVDGVSEGVATYIKIISACLDRAGSKGEGLYLKNHGDVRGFAFSRLSGLKREKLELYCFDEEGLLLRSYSFSGVSAHAVTIPTKTVLDIISEIHPHTIAAAHNHITGVCKPTPADDEFTALLLLIAQMNNIRLLDHYIITRDKLYSYFDETRLETVRIKYSIDKAAAKEDNAEEDNEKSAAEEGEVDGEEYEVDEDIDECLTEKPS